MSLRALSHEMQFLLVRFCSVVLAAFGKGYGKKARIQPLEAVLSKSSFVQVCVYRIAKCVFGLLNKMVVFDMMETFLFSSFLRLVSNCAWFSSLVLFFIASVVFSILIDHVSQERQTALRTSRVVIMGVALGVCIIVVSHSIDRFESTFLPLAPSS